MLYVMIPLINIKETAVLHTGFFAKPVCATAFAGLLTWEKSRYFRIVNYQNDTLLSPVTVGIS